MSGVLLRLVIPRWARICLEHQFFTNFWEQTVPIRRALSSQFAPILAFHKTWIVRDVSIPSNRALKSIEARVREHIYSKEFNVWNSKSLGGSIFELNAGDFEHIQSSQNSTIESEPRLDSSLCQGNPQFILTVWPLIWTETTWSASRNPGSRAG